MADERADAITSIRSRVAEHVGSWLKDEECVQLALALTTRDVDGVVNYMFNKQVVKSVTAAGYDAISITVREWKQLFGPRASPTRQAQLLKMFTDRLLDEPLREVGDALRRTIAEPAQAAAWERLWTKGSVFLAVHMQADEDMIESALGNLVSADCRRLEDLRSRIDDRGAATMLLADAIAAISQTVT